MLGVIMLNDVILNVVAPPLLERELLALPAKAWKSLPGANTLAYSANS
jgi:hypothetical protein